jgi:Heavy metal binding domain
MGFAAIVLVSSLLAAQTSESDTRESYAVYLCAIHPDAQAAGPGLCPTCGRDLVLRSLVSSYSCPMHPAIDETGEGACPICGMKLVRTAREVQWFCPGRADIVSATAGLCPDGRPMETRTVPMAHGDHNPRHGGILFMAPNGYHHLEGALDEDREFSLYLYDDFTRPLVVEGFQARAGELPMAASSDGSFLSVKLEPADPGKPVEVVLHLRFPDEEEEARFDFIFPLAAEASVALPEFRIPESAEDVYREILVRNERIQELLRRGAWPDLYIPALEAKDLVLALSETQGERVERAARKLVRAAWLLDTHGDRGNRIEVEAAYRLFQEAVSELSAVHAN